MKNVELFYKAPLDYMRKDNFTRYWNNKDGRHKGKVIQSS